MIILICKENGYIAIEYVQVFILKFPCSRCGFPKRTTIIITTRSAILVKLILGLPDMLYLLGSLLM